MFNIDQIQSFVEQYCLRIAQFQRAQNLKFLKFFGNVSLEWGSYLFIYLTYIGQYYDQFDSYTVDEQIQLTRVGQNLSFQFRGLFAPPEIVNYLTFLQEFFISIITSYQVIINITNILLNQCLFINPLLQNLDNNIMLVRKFRYIEQVIIEVIQSQSDDYIFLKSIASKIQSNLVLRSIDFQILNAILQLDSSIKIKTKSVIRGIKSSVIDRRMNAIQLFSSIVQIQNNIDILFQCQEQNLVEYCQNCYENGDLFMEDIIEIFREYGLMSFE